MLRQLFIKFIKICIYAISIDRCTKNHTDNCSSCRFCKDGKCSAAEFCRTLEEEDRH